MCRFAIDFTQVAVDAKFLSCKYFFISLSSLFPGVLNAQNLQFPISQTNTTEHQSVAAQRATELMPMPPMISFISWFQAESRFSTR